MLSGYKDCPFHHLKYLNMRDNEVGPDEADANAFIMLPPDMYLETDRCGGWKLVVPSLQAMRFVAAPNQARRARQGSAWNLFDFDGETRSLTMFRRRLRKC